MLKREFMYLKRGKNGMERNWNMELFIQKKSVELTFCR